MPDNDCMKSPETYSLVTWAWVLVFSLWGGLADYLNTIARKRRFSWLELLAKMVVSGFSGVLTFLICEASELNQMYTAAFVGMSGYLGTATIYLLMDLFARKVLGRTVQDLQEPCKAESPEK